MAWERPAVALGLFVALVGLLVVSRRRGSLGRVFLGITLVLGSLWLAAVAAVRSDYRDADGFIDCWPSCTPPQDGVGITLFWGPVAFVVLGVVAAVLAALKGPRGGEGARRTRLDSGSQPS